MRRLTAIFTLSCLVGCRRADSPLNDQTCSLDANVAPNEPCTSSAQCSGGLACNAEDGGDAARCRPALDHPRRTQLITGFMVDELALDTDSDGGPALLAWRAPPGTRYVTCVLFGCAPELAANQDAVTVISNYDQCALRRQTFVKSTEGAFEPDVADPATSECRIVQYITELSVGCWAYDETRLSAASRLVPLRPSEVPSLDQLAVDECRAVGDERSTEHLACYRGKDIALGICHQGNCLGRCEIGGAACETPSRPVQEASTDGQVDASVPPLTVRTCEAVAVNLGVCATVGSTDE